MANGQNWKSAKICQKITKRGYIDSSRERVYSGLTAFFDNTVRTFFTWARCWATASTATHYENAGQTPQTSSSGNCTVIDVSYSIGHILLPSDLNSFRLFCDQPPLKGVSFWTISVAVCSSQYKLAAATVLDATPLTDEKTTNWR